MEILLFSLFFIVSLIFFITGKDDFGRKENKLITKDKKIADVSNSMEFETQKETQKESQKEVELEST